MAGFVTAGDYQGAYLAVHYKTGLAIMQGVFKKNWICINKTTVAKYEIVQTEESTSTTDAVVKGVAGSLLFGPAGIAAAVAAKKKNWFTVAVEFSDGKRSLIEVDDGFFKVLQRVLF